jgi:putative Ca2+/H+ antiporter (TMEM165/GDT1 family)
MTAFFSMFIPVFLHELGDATQIGGTLFATEGERAPSLVFLASANALVTSAALATLLGGVLRDFVSDPWLKIAVGAGLLLIGAFMLWSARTPA